MGSMGEEVGWGGWVKHGEASATLVILICPLVLHILQSFNTVACRDGSYQESRVVSVELVLTESLF